MTRLKVCRLCLADDLPLRMIANTYLQDIFEKLTNVQLITNNMKPIVVCYLCCIRLHHSYQLRRNSIRSEVLLDQIILGAIPQNRLIIPNRSFGRTLVAVISTSGEGWDDINPVPPQTLSEDKNEMLKRRRTSEVPLESVLKINSDMSKVSVGDIEIIESDEDHSEIKAIKKEMGEQTDIGVKETGRSITDRLIIENIEEEMEIKKEPDIEEQFIHPATNQIIHSNYTPSNKMRADLKRCDDFLDSPPNKKPAVLTEQPQLIYYNHVLPTLISIQPWASQIQTIPQILPNINYNSNLVVQEQQTWTQTTWHSSTGTGLSVGGGDGVIFHQQCPQNPVHEETRQFPSATFGQFNAEKQLTTSSLSDVIQDGSSEKNHDVGAVIIQDVGMESEVQSKLISTQVIEENKNTRSDGDIIIHPEELKPDQPSNIGSIKNNKYTSLLVNKQIDAKNHKTNLVNKIGMFKTNGIEKTTALAGDEHSSTTQNETNDNSSTNLRPHTETNKPENNFQCHLCEESFSKMCGLLVHIRKRHPNELTFECNICKKRFSTRSDLKTHKGTHIKDPHFKCDRCRKTYNSKKSLQYHICEGEHNFKCHVCDKTFPRMRERIKHIKQDHQNVLPLECNICKKRFAKRNELSKHMHCHNDPNLKCHICNIPFISTSTLRAHNKRLHKNTNDIEKPTLETGAELSSTTSDRHFNNDLKLNCDICNIPFISTESLQAHNKSLHDKTNDIEKPTAEVVDELTSTSETVDLTEPEIRFDCHVCEESFPRMGGLVVHIRKSHPKVLPYECFICKRRFTKNSGLIKHMRCHTDPEVFKCDKCRKTYHSKRKFQDHKRLHINNDK